MQKLVSGPESIIQKISGPAPSLTLIQFDAIRGDADSDWQYLWGAPSSNAPCTGNNLFVAVTFIGYPDTNSVLFYDNTTLINSQMTWYINMQEPLYGPDKIVYGFREYYGIPSTAIAAHSRLYVEAKGVNGGHASASLNNVQIIPKT